MRAKVRHAVSSHMLSHENKVRHAVSLGETCRAASTELELIPVDLREITYIKFPIQLEQYLMEGTYRKVEEVQNKECVLYRMCSLAHIARSRRYKTSTQPLYAAANASVCECVRASASAAAHARKAGEGGCQRPDARRNSV
jgi:hypothetical protein